MTDMISAVVYGKPKYIDYCEYSALNEGQRIMGYTVPSHGVWYKTSCSKLIGTSEGRACRDNGWVYCMNCGNMISER